MPAKAPRFRILLVEDEPAIRELVQAVLEGDAVEVRCAPDGPQAIKEAGRRTPHLVLLDVVLPGLDGFAVCRLMRASPVLGEVPIYMLTAKVRPADHESARRAGASGYIEKPFRAQELQKLVGELRRARR